MTRIECICDECGKTASADAAKKTWFVVYSGPSGIVVMNLTKKELSPALPVDIIDNEKDVCGAACLVKVVAKAAEGIKDE